MIDQLGIVVSCAETDHLVDAVGDISVSNPVDDMGLQVVWNLDRCPHLRSLTLRFGEAGHELIGECDSDTPSSGLPLYLTLKEPLPAEFFHAYLTAAPGASPIETPSLPPAVAPSSVKPDANARDRIDRFWQSFGDVGCVGMAAPDSIETVAKWADLIVIARPTGAQPWDDAPYPPPSSLVSLRITEIIKGDPTFQQDGFIQLLATDLPPANVADIDHLLFLNVVTRDERVYYLTDSFPSVFANVEGRVVTPEYDAIRRAYGNKLYPTLLDGTSFDKLVERVRNASGAADELVSAIARRGYFAC